MRRESLHGDSSDQSVHRAALATDIEFDIGAALDHE
jgi:hypothetical protein